MHRNKSWRYQCGPISIYDYDHFLVKCPKCQGQALVSLNQPGAYQSGKLFCGHCLLSKLSSELYKFSLAINQHCPDCGKKQSFHIDQTSKKQPIRIACTHCGEEHLFHVKSEQKRIYYNKPVSGMDPVFCLPFWLSGIIRGKHFWALNPEHLEDIRLYVASGLRSRQSPSGMNMVERLPKFIQLAKNRTKILKLIEHLQKTIVKP